MDSPISSTVQQTGTGELTGDIFSPPFSPNEATSSYQEIESAGVELLESLSAGSKNFEALSNADSVSVEECLKASVKFALEFSGIVDLFNRLPGPGKSRDSEIGNIMLPLSATAWGTAKQSREISLAQDLFLKHYYKNKQFSYPMPPWLKNAFRHLAVSECGKGFPDRRVYLQKSNSLSSRLQEIEERLKDASDKLQTLNQREAAAQASSGKSMYADGIANLNDQITTIEAEIPPLFNELDDVRPEDVPELMGAVHVKVALKPEGLNEFLHAASSIERVLTLANQSDLQLNTSSTVLRVPIAVGKGKIEAYEAPIDEKVLKEIRESPELLTSLVKALVTYRKILCEILPSLKNIKGLGAKGIEQVNKQLLEPFANSKKYGKTALLRMCEIDSAPLQEVLCELLTQPVRPSKSSQDWVHVFDNLDNHDILSWALCRRLDASNGELAHSDLLRSSDKVDEAFGGLLSQLNMFIQEKKYKDLALFINEQIQEISTQDNILRKLGLIAAVSHLSSNEDMATRLRYQIPQLELMKDIGASISGVPEQVTATVNKNIHNIVKTFSASLVDFYRGEYAQELWEFLEDYRYICEHPEAVEGLPGNEIMRSGILLEGEFGAGKTYLANCIITELGIRKIVISPDSKQDDNKTMRDVVKNKLNEAKEILAKGEPVAIFVDEAESIVFDRKSARITQEQYDLTDYTLQEINDIRINYPKALLIMATNYIGIIDEAALREGRLDIKIVMGPPNKETRKAIIADSIKKQKDFPDISDSELDELVELTDGFMILPIIRTINYLAKVYIPRKNQGGEELKASFELIKEQYEEERKRHEKTMKRRKDRGSQYARTEPESE